MNEIILLVISVSALAWLLFRLNGVIDSDGLGHRPPPRSHHDEQARERELLRR